MHREPGKGSTFSLRIPRQHPEIRELSDIEARPATRYIPVIIITSHTLDAQDRDRLARQTEVILSKDSLSRELAINRIRDALRKSGVGTNATRISA